MKNTYNTLYALDSYWGSRLWFWCMCMISCVPLFATWQTAAHQALLFMVFSQRNTGVGYYFLLQGIFQTQRKKPTFHKFPELQVDFCCWITRILWPWTTKWSREETNRILSRGYTGHSKYPFLKTQEMTTHGHHQMVNRNQTDHILCSWKWRNSIQPAKRRPGVDCGSDHQYFIAKFWLKLNKIGKTTRPFRYDLNQFPYDYTVEVTNRFKGLDLVDRVPQELWKEVCNTVQEAVTKTTPKKEKCKKAK